MTFLVFWLPIRSVVRQHNKTNDTFLKEGKKKKKKKANEKKGSFNLYVLHKGHRLKLNLSVKKICCNQNWT